MTRLLSIAVAALCVAGTLQLMHAPARAQGASASAQTPDLVFTNAKVGMYKIM